MTAILPYGAWRSPITSDLIVGEAIGLGDILVDGADIYWVEGRAREGGRNVVVRRGRDGGIADITPAPFSARTRVHEYGGGAVMVHGGAVYFSNFADQRLYRQIAGQAPEALTPEPAAGTSWRYAAGLFDAARRRWIGVRETHGPDGRVDNTLVAVEPDVTGPGQVLAEGHDFYASPELSPDGKRLAWLTWDHPNMPWVGTELWLADIAADGALATPRLVAGAAAESIFQPQFAPDGVLYFVSDRSGWWNPYRCDLDWALPGRCAPARPSSACRNGCSGNRPTPSCRRSSSSARIMKAASTILRGSTSRAAGSYADRDLPFYRFRPASAWPAAISCAAPARRPSRPRLSRSTRQRARSRSCGSSAPAASDAALRRYFSTPQHIEFPTERGLTAYANYYPPTSPDHAPPAGENPPLVVKCHGGPTASTSTSA